ncbi:type II secretion system protein [Shewanella youngdeokensis]|uniref:Type II secretion system protein n=1 Tax=Shewanella youngdeokensis TaxID=2999068 RepID=A0ABZ0JYL4_9GAMM|nr:type II secretion system protein [Shewanella sp. DAU334]
MHKRSRGFTLIELVVVIIILGILAVVAAPKFLSLSTDAKIAVLQGMQGSLKSTRDLVAAKMLLHPEKLDPDANTFTLDNGLTILVAANYPDARWNNGYMNLVDFDSVTFTNDNVCDESTRWCARHRGPNWFFNSGYSEASVGRGFVIFPKGNDVTEDRCYLYHYTPNDRGVASNGGLPVVELDLSECDE